MAGLIRKLVSGSKRRYKDDRYDLDLTYITPRVIAMALPGEGVHTLYRNSISDVSRFLADHHGDNYKIINVSGLKYNYELFND